MSLLPPVPMKWVLDASREPPVYTRPLVGSELTMHRYWNAFDADGEVCIGVDFTSSMNAEELSRRAREALSKLRFVCPIIACTIEDDVSPQWVYTPSTDREAWLDLAFAVEERGESLDPTDFIQRINLTRLPYTNRDGVATLFKVYLLTASEKSGNSYRKYGLYFHGTHAIIDAGPALHALNLMCEWVSGNGMNVTTASSEEWKNLPVDPITATGGPSPEWEIYGSKLFQEFAEQDSRTTPFHTPALPSRPPNKLEAPFCYALTLSESETAAIIAQTKKLGVSVTVLFHAAHCLAQFKMNPIQGAEAEVDFSSLATVIALERYMKPPVNPRTHLVSSFVLLPLRFSMAQPLMESSEKGKLYMTMKLLKERFDRHLSNPCLPHILAVRENVSSPGAREQAETKPTDDVQVEDISFPPWCCAFNNLGMLEQKLQTQHGEIVALKLRIGNRLRHCMTVHMWTMHSKFHFQIQGSPAWGEETIRTLLHESVRIALLVLDDSDPLSWSVELQNAIVRGDQCR